MKDHCDDLLLKKSARTNGVYIKFEIDSGATHANVSKKNFLINCSQVSFMWLNLI